MNITAREKDYTLAEIFNAIQYSPHAIVQQVVDGCSKGSLNGITDAMGYSPMHVAVKRGDIGVMRILLKSGVKLDSYSKSEPSILPIHAAATAGLRKAIHLLLDNGQDVNAVDSNGCSSLLIATQHNQIQTVIYLLHHGADATHRDKNGDTAVHWAALKGYQELIGLLLHFSPLQVNAMDNFGQTPLHLAALSSHESSLWYLLSEKHADPSLRDMSGNTALQVTINKNLVRSEWIIRRCTTSHSLQLIISLGLYRLRDLSLIVYLLWGFSEEESTIWVYRMTFYANVIACFCGVYFAMSTVLADLYILHAVNSVVMCLWWILFITCSWMKPVYVEEGSPERHTVRGSGNAKSRSLELSSESQEGAPSDLHPRSYEAALALMGSDAALDGRNLPSVCHSCGLQRPLRAKHCKFMRKCVVKYDHFCPYVYACVSRDSYKYYVCMLVTHMAAYTLFMLAASIYWYRAGVSYIFMGYIVYSTGMAVMIAILVAYHTKLITCNLTTNEDVNSFKYDYMRDDDGKFNNVFDLHNRWDNTLDGLFPSKKLYYTRQEVLWDRHSRNDIDCRGGNSKAERIDEKVVYSANGVTALTGGATATTFGDDHNLHHRDNNRTNQR